MQQENLDVVRHMFDAFNRGDLPAVLAAFDEDCELHEPVEMPDRLAEGFRGHEGIRHWFTNLREVGGVRFEVTAATAGGDVVYSELVGRGVGQASSAPFEWPTFGVFHMRRGKILRTQAFLERDAALRAAGRA